MNSAPIKKAFLINVELALLATAISLAAIEFTFRIFNSLAPPAADWSDRPKPYFFAENSPSPRDSDYTPEKGANVFRIVVLGDSFTYGEKLQVDDTFPKRLERFLNLNLHQPKIEVINYGVPGFSTRQEALAARNVIKTYRPDLLILQITLNDPELWPKSANRRFSEESGALTLNDPIFKQWKSLGFVLTRLHNTATHSAYKNYFFDLFDNPKTWQNFRAGLDDLKKVAERAQLPIVAITFPLFSHPLTSDYPFTRIHQKISEQLAARNIPALDLFEAFKNIPHERLQVEPGRDRHPNEIANRIAAETILPWLASMKLLPTDALPKKFASDKKVTRAIARGKAF